jgi:hypothetical protein
LVGTLYNSNVKNSNTTGKVRGNSDMGGLVGKLVDDGSVTASYYDSQTSEKSDTGKGETRTTEQMVKGTANGNINGVALHRLEH